MSEPPADDRLRKVYLEVTTACNLDCGMCIRRVWDAPRAAAMSRDAYERLLFQFSAIPSVSTIHFGGFGEPLVHPDLLEFIRQAKTAGLQVELTTNGLLLDPRVAAALVDLELDRLYVSMDGPATDRGGVFHDAPAAVQANLYRLHRTRLARGASQPETALLFVASRRNIDHLPEMRRLARELGVSRIMVSNLVAYTPELEAETLYGRWTINCGNHEPTPWNPAVELPRLDPRTDATRIMDHLAVRGSAVSVRGMPVYGGGMVCRFVHEGRLAIDPAGRVSPCLPLLHGHHYHFRGARHTVRPFHLGRLAETPLAEIWDGERYRAFRRRVRAFDFSPCIDCAACDLRETNEDDCFGSGFPSCGDCLWAAGFVQCP